MIAAQDLVGLVQLYFWPFLRISALFIVSPVFNANTVPVRVRVVLAIMMAALLAPFLKVPVEVDLLSPAGLLLASREVAIGLLLGFLVQMVFAAVVVAGETLAMSMGLGFAMSVDPQNGVQVPVISQLNVILATLLFLAIDGHLLVLAALARSFILLPIEGVALDSRFFFSVFELGGTIFATALLLALPAVTAVLVTNIAFGVITRAAPQLNIFAVGFPVTIAVGLIFMMLGLPGFLSKLERVLVAVIDRGLAIF